MRPIAALLIIGGLALPAAADTVGLYAGMGQWQQSFDGDVTSGTTSIDVNTDLGLGDTDNNLFYVALEHPIPMLPNLAVEIVDIENSGASTLTRSIDFSGQTFSISDDIATQIDISNVDAVAYYEILDNVVSLDLGFAIKFVEGEVAIATTLESSRAQFEGALPMLYGKVRADLPLTGLWVAGRLQGIGYDGNQLVETQFVVGWESPLRVGVEAGYRSFSLELDEVDEINDATIEVDGFFAALNVHF